MDLSNLKPPAGQVKTQRRIGRGMGSGRGKYSGRGAKGQKSISGYSAMRGFEGGQMPLHRRLPKRGFTNALFRKHFAIVNVGTFEKLEATSFTPQQLLDLGVIHKLGDGLKVLASGELTRKVHVEAHCFSKAAEEKIKAAGGSVAVIEPKKTGIALAAEGKQSKSEAAKAVKRSARALALSTQAAESAAPTKAKKGEGAAAASTPESESSAPKKAKKGEGSSAAGTQKGDGSAAAKAKKSK
jgi:large subunit ribosomal protein L15